MTAVGVASYRQMDDRTGHRRCDATCGTRSPAPAGVYAADRRASSRSRAARGPASPPRPRRLARLARGRGATTSLLTREPGDTEVGAELRAIVLDPATGDDLATAPRRCSTPPTRPSTSTAVVAPGAGPRGGRGHRPLRRLARWPTRAPGATWPTGEVERVARWATDDLRPHLTVLLDLPPQRGLTRFDGARPDRGRVGWSSTSGCAQMFLQLAGGPRSTTSSSTPGGRSTRSPRDPGAAAAAARPPRRHPAGAGRRTRTPRPASGTTRTHSVTGVRAVSGPHARRAAARGRAPARRRSAGQGMTHAWLFTGPPGSGRSNVALAFAAALQCERGTGCGECHACRTALAGVAPRRQHHPLGDLGALHRRHARAGAPLGAGAGRDGATR